MSVCGISDTCVFGILLNKMFTILSAANVHLFYCFIVDMLILWVLEKEGNSLRALQQGFPFLFCFFAVEREKYQGSDMCNETENHRQPKIADTLLWEITAHVPEHGNKAIKNNRISPPAATFTI